MIRIWETASTKESYAVKTLWRGIGTKVMKVKVGLGQAGCQEFCLGVFQCRAAFATKNFQHSKKCTAFFYTSLSRNRIF